MKQNTGPALSRALAAGAAAGIAGGVAEVAFMGIYSKAAGINAVNILNLITFTFFDKAVSLGPRGALIGVLIHFGLSAAVGLFFGLFAATALKGGFTYTRALFWGAASLAAIWAFNFFVMLPAYNAEFLKVVSPAPAFFSKLSFGVILSLSIKLIRAAAKGPAGACPRPSHPASDAAGISERDVRGLIS